MIIGIGRVELFFHGNGSLKGKRQRVKSIIARVRNKFNVSIAEIEDNDNWEKAVLGFSAVSNDNRFVNSLLLKVIEFIDHQHQGELIDHQIEIL